MTYPHGRITQVEGIVLLLFVKVISSALCCRGNCYIYSRGGRLYGYIYSISSDDRFERFAKI